MNTNNFIVTTTEHIENATIKCYLDAICTNIVIGTNVLSDFAASLSDFSGGKFDSYKRKLEYAYTEARRELEQETHLHFKDRKRWGKYHVENPIRCRGARAWRQTEN